MELIKKTGVALFGGACIFYSEYSKSGRLLDAFVVGSASFILIIAVILVYEAAKFIMTKIRRSKEEQDEDGTG